MNLSLKPVTSLSAEQVSLFSDSPNPLTHAHNPSLIPVLEKTFGWKGKAFLIFDDQKLIGYFPCVIAAGRLVSMPHFSHGGIVTSAELNGFDKQILYDQILSLSSKYFEIDPEDSSEFFIRDNLKFGNHIKDDKVISFINLKGKPYDQLIPSDQMSKVRKSLDYGILCSSGGKDLLRDFYKVYSRNMHRLGSPPLPYKFFYNILDQYKDGDAKIYVAYQRSVPIGGAFLMSYNGYYENTWFSTSRKYNKLYPAQLLHFEMIRFASQHGGHTYSFGRSTRGSGVHEFKRRWNTEEKIVYWNYSEPFRDLRKNKLFPYLWRLLPYHLATLAGPSIAKKIL